MFTWAHFNNPLLSCIIFIPRRRPTIALPTRWLSRSGCHTFVAVTSRCSALITRPAWRHVRDREASWSSFISMSCTSDKNKEIVVARSHFQFICLSYLFFLCTYRYRMECKFPLIDLYFYLFCIWYANVCVCMIMPVIMNLYCSKPH